MRMKKKNKALKTFGFSALALLMGAVGAFAFAPLIPNQANASETTTTTGLGLDPKNDPVVYTTESGLEIRMSNNKITSTLATKTTKNYSYTQDLTGFYYFTMGTYSGTIYTAEGGDINASYSVSNAPINWIILGLGNNTSYFTDAVAKYLYTEWKNNTFVEGSNGALGTYFYENHFENSSPAGALIDNTVSAKTYIFDKVKASIPVNPGNLNEIPEGCMLVLSERLLGQMYFNSSGSLIQGSLYTGIDDVYLYGATAQYGNRYRFIGNKNITNNNTTNYNGQQTWTTSGNAGGSLYNHINSMFSKNNATGAVIGNSLGFTQAQADLIVPQQLYTYYSNGQGYNYQETPTTDGGTYYTMFPLAYKGAYSSTYQNFCVEDYLPNKNQRTATFINSNISFCWRLRSGAAINQHDASNVLPSGGFQTWGTCNAFGVRPAMVMKLQ